MEGRSTGESPGMDMVDDLTKHYLHRVYGGNVCRDEEKDGRPRERET